MQDHKYFILEKAVKLLETYNIDNESAIVSKKEIEIFKSIKNEIKYYSNEYFRISLIGEFKSGKSTLLNSILGGYYSATDLLEMTSWIARYFPSNEEYCQVLDRAGEVHSIPLSEFLLKTGKRMYSHSDLEKFARVDIGCTSSTESKIVFIDCPGYGTINKKNEILMTQSLNESDLIILCVDITALGGEREASLIKMLLETKTPHICVCTKSDNLQTLEEKSEITDYLCNKLGVIKENVFFTSALIESDENGICQLKEYLNNNIMVSKEDIRKKAEEAYFNRIFISIQSKLTNIQKILREKKSEIDLYRNNLRIIEKSVKTETVIQCRSWFLQHFMQNMTRNIVQDLMSIVMGNKQNLNDDLLNIVLRKHLSEDYLRRILNDLTVIMKDFATKKWIDHYEDLLIISANTSSSNNSAKLNFGLTQFSTKMTNSPDSAFETGVMTSAGIGAALSAYAAWLGPMAPFVSIGSALTMIGLPITLLGGGVAFGLAKYKQKKKEASLGLQFEMYLEEYKSVYFDNVLKEQIENSITELSSHYIEFLSSNYRNANFAQIPADSIDIQIENLEELHKLIDSQYTKQLQY